MATLTDEEHKDIFENWFDKENIIQMLEKNSKERGPKKAMAYRTVEKVEKEMRKDAKGNEKAWEISHMSDITYISYTELWEMITNFGKGLAEMGFKKGSKVAIFEDTRWEWITSMLGLWTQEYVGVTVYANLGYDALVYALKEAECGAIICNGANVPRVAKLMSDFGIKESVIIYLDELPANCDAGAHKVLPWKTVVDMGAASSRDYSIITNNDQDVLIMYTSGTTGNPKGVCHSIGALTQGSRGLNDRLTDLIGHEEEETYLSYLPAAHVFEFICECIMLGRGTVVCFGSPRTLTDLFARPAGDITTFKPFFLIGVPRIFETIKKGAEGKLPPVGTVKRALFDRAYASRLAALKEGYDTPFWNEKVFKIPRAMMGGKMRGICSGGAPLAHKTQEWMNVVIGQPVAQGYGMTETVCNTTVQRTGELNCVAGQLLKGWKCAFWIPKPTSTPTSPTHEGSCWCAVSSCSRGTTSRRR
ncbi:long-chain acyl-CoA synthetase [Angomonas deanei]|nr:long-chain acyl-CoA synthetase [Angomonas deanei]|eukprot:EPY26185.1 long-chain acyl-CoA synthetase [Angomonas deanei]